MPRLLAALALFLVLSVALVYVWITHGTARRHERLEAQLSVQQWLTELAKEMAESSQQKLFPNRAELERKTVRETRHVLEGQLSLSRVPVETPRVLELGTGAELPFSVRGARELNVDSAGPVLLEYAVDDLTVYWVDRGRFFRQRRDGGGATELTQLNPELPVDDLSFEVSGAQVRIALQAGSFRGVQVVTVR